jgi:hypothetical protein
VSASPKLAPGTIEATTIRKLRTHIIPFVVVLFVIGVRCVDAQELFEIKPVADGVYAAIARPAYKTNCNAAVVMLDDSVLVVDTHSKPSAARGLIAQIKT